MARGQNGDREGGGHKSGSRLVPCADENRQQGLGQLSFQKAVRAYLTLQLRAEKKKNQKNVVNWEREGILSHGA